MTIQAEAKPLEQTIRAVVIRADGTREDLGIVSYYHRNPFRRFLFRIIQFFRGR